MDNSERVKSLIESAQEANERQDFDSAIALCSEALALSPTNLKGRFLRGLVFQSIHNHTAAVADFADILSNTTQDVVRSKALYSRAVSLHALRQFQEAATDCEAILKIDHHYHDARYLYCITLKALGATDQAIAQATVLIDSYPHYLDAIYTRATLRYMNSDWKGAIEDFSQYLASENTNRSYRHFSHFFRGVSYHYLDANDKALADLNVALILHPNNPTTLARRALIYSALGKEKEAAADLQRVKELSDAQQAK